jgi:hypothetical protein
MGTMEMVSKVCQNFIVVGGAIKIQYTEPIAKLRVNRVESASAVGGATEWLVHTPLLSS